MAAKFHTYNPDAMDAVAKGLSRAAEEVLLGNAPKSRSEAGGRIRTRNRLDAMGCFDESGDLSALGRSLRQAVKRKRGIPSQTASQGEDT